MGSIRQIPKMYKTQHERYKISPALNSLIEHFENFLRILTIINNNMVVAGLKSLFGLALAGAGIGLAQAAFNPTCSSNLVVYWGQNSYGAAHSSDTANFQKPLSYYCQDDTIDMIPLAFLYVFFGTGNDPVLNFANICNDKDNSTFSGTDMIDCPSIGTDIKTCQANGKAVTLSLGGSGGTYGFSSDDQAEAYADTIWNFFLGGSSSTRPFGDAVLDGVDLDIEQGGSTGYSAFINRLRTHYASDTNKNYYVTGAPQCVYPDASLSPALNTAWFDLVMVQFYNNPCGLGYYSNNLAWNYGVWDYWATHISVNPNVRVLIGAPASSTAAGSGYVALSQLQTIAQGSYSSARAFGGVMFWDASQAWTNSIGSQNYAQGTKAFLKSFGCSQSSSLPSCSSNTYNSATAYSGNTQVALNGYNFINRWWTQGDSPATDYSTAGAWNILGACGSTSSGNTTTSKSTSTSISTTTSTRNKKVPKKRRLQ